MTNNFGDFEFEGLPDNTEYSVKIEAKGYQPQQLKANTMVVVYLDVIKLVK